MKPFVISKSHWTYRWMDKMSLAPWRRTDLCSYGRGLFHAIVIKPIAMCFMFGFLAALAFAILFVVAMMLLLPIYVLGWWTPDFVSKDAVYVAGFTGWGTFFTLTVVMTAGTIADMLQRRDHNQPGPVGASWRAFKDKTCVPVKFKSGDVK